MELFGLKYDMASTSETLALISEAVILKRSSAFIRSDINVGTIVSAKDDQIIQEYINESDVVNLDGMGAILGAKILGKPLPERVAGADLFEEVLSLSDNKGYSVYFLGATKYVNELTYLKAINEYPTLKVAGKHDGYFFDAQKEIVELITLCEPDILFVGIKSPEKEYFIKEWKDKLNVKVILGVGGTFDVYCGEVERAPKWVQRIGMEWLFRVYQEPKRMWKRYLISNFTYLKMLINEMRS